jgi:hypothetical protein
MSFYNPMYASIGCMGFFEPQLKELRCSSYTEYRVVTGDKDTSMKTKCYKTVGANKFPISKMTARFVRNSLAHENG